jgi:hypothetical protein
VYIGSVVPSLPPDLRGSLPTSTLIKGVTLAMLTTELSTVVESLAVLIAVMVKLSVLTL